MNETPPKKSRTLILAEFALLLTLFFVFAGSATPDVNEAHYLTKAKNYWQPDWCGRDLFLSSANAHLVYFWLFGWVTQFLSLPATAWLGRLIGWVALAASWQWMINGMALGRHQTQRGFALLTAAISAALWQYAHMAGEWVLGGFEAKVPAYACVFAALAAAFRSRWFVSAIFVAAAIALHPIVGGWSAIALLYAAVTDRSSRTRISADLRGAGVSAAIVFVLCVMIAMLGLLPALLLDRAPADISSVANRIYVFGRLPHHLVAHRMSFQRILRFGIMVVAWLLVRHRTKSCHDVRIVQRFADASLLITVLGIAIGYFLPTNTAASLLQYYWFRLSDIAIPMAIAVLVVEIGARWYLERSFKFGVSFTLLMVGLLVAVAARFSEHRRDPRPPGDRQGQILSAENQAQALRRYDDWCATCKWASANTDSDTLFLTPMYSQTFKWHAGRAELATWKDIPQDATSVVEWSRRRQQVADTAIYDSQRHLDKSALDVLLAEHQVDYLVTVREFGRLQLEMPLIYRNQSFEIYRCK